MTTLVLHIGSPKAGSSAIQASLMKADWSAGWSGIPPNPYGKPYPGGFIAGLYLKPEALPRFLAERHQQDHKRFQHDMSRYRRCIRRCIRPLFRKQPQVLVLSCEYLWRFPKSSIEALRRDFEDLGCDRFLVIAYVREPGAVYGSALQQWARLSTNLQRFDPLVWRYELRHRLLTWQSVFGENLIVRPFDSGQLLDGCVVLDFHDQLEQALADLPRGPDLKPETDVNRSATAEELVAMHMMLAGRVHPLLHGSADGPRLLARLWKELLMKTNRQCGTPIRVRTEVIRLIRQRHQDDLTWLADHHGVRFKTSAKSSLPSADLQTLRSASNGPPQLLDLIEEPADQTFFNDLLNYLHQKGSQL